MFFWRVCEVDSSTYLNPGKVEREKMTYEDSNYNSRTHGKNEQVNKISNDADFCLVWFGDKAVR